MSPIQKWAVYATILKDVMDPYLWDNDKHETLAELRVEIPSSRNGETEIGVGWEIYETSTVCALLHFNKILKELNMNIN